MNGNSISLLSYLHSTHSCSQQSSRRFGLILLGLLVVGWYFDWFLRINFGLLHQHGYGGANDDLGVRIRVGDDRSKLMFVDLGWYGLIWVAHGGRARGLSGLRVAVAELVGLQENKWQIVSSKMFVSGWESIKTC